MRISMCQAAMALVFVTIAQARVGNAQVVLDQKVTIKIENMDVEQALEKIEQSANVQFMYNHKIFKKGSKISHRFKNSRLEKVLETVLAPFKVDYEVANNHIILKKTGNVSSLTDNLESPSDEEMADKKVSGTISDNNGQPVTGATVVVKGTTKGVTTDINGNFSIDVPDDNAVLVVSYLGYLTQEITVGNQTAINFKMEEDVKSLEDVIVVGYGEQKKTSLTGAISSIAAKDVAALPVPSVEAALQGRAPGVTVVNNGEPGATPIVRIRGNGSLSYAAGPLYVVDGFPTSDLNNFDNRDIASVEVLKDASAAAIYGSRAANGVVLVTTKKGTRDGKFTVNLDSYYGTQSAWKQLDLLNRDQYVKYATEISGTPLPANIANQNQPIYAGSNQTYAQTETNWQDAMFRSAAISQTQLSMTGGNDKSRVYSSAGYFKQDGIMLGMGYERGNFRLNSDHDINKRITVGQTFSLSYGDKRNEQQSGGRTQIQHIIRSVPYLPIEDPTKLGGYRAPNNDDGTDPENPVRIALQDISKTQTTKVFGTVYLELKIMDWLKFKTTAGLDNTNLVTTNYLPIYNDGRNGRNTAQLGNNQTTNTSIIYTNQLSFDKSFGKHNIGAVAVAEQQSFVSNIMATNGQYPTNDVQQLNGAVSQSLSGTRQENLLISYVGRVNYDFGGKYLLSVAIREDGSSKFAPGKKWGTFPSASVGWRINEENFMKSIKQISELKLRGSYGLLGFNGIGNYDWQLVTQTDQTLYPFGSNVLSGSFLNTLGNLQLQWETSKMTNVGFDLGLLNNRITFSAEYFNKLTENLILSAQLPPSDGYIASAYPPANLGSMRNYGFEFQAGYNYTKNGFKFNANGNLAIIRNEVVTFGQSISAGSTSDYAYNVTQTAAGQPIQSFYGYETDGIFQNAGEVAAGHQPGAAPGDIRFKDLNGDGVIDSKDQTYLGSYLPDFSYGLNLSANYKGFDLTMFFQGVQGNKIYNITKFYTQGSQRLFNAGTDVLNAWTPTNTNTDVPRIAPGDPNNNNRNSDRFLEDGSYVRLKSLVFGYTIPERFIQTFTKGGVKKVRLYVSFQNLLTITSYSGYDPEVGTRPGGGGISSANNTSNTTSLLTNGVDYGQFPAARSFMGGIQIGF